MRTTRAPTAVSLATTGDRIDAANTIVARRPDVRILFTSGFSGHKSGRQDLIKGGHPSSRSHSTCPNCCPPSMLCSWVDDRAGNALSGQPKHVGVQVVLLHETVERATGDLGTPRGLGHVPEPLA